MAVRLLMSNATLSTSAGSWKKVEAMNLLADAQTAVTDVYNAGNGLVTSQFTLPNGVSIQGAMVFLRQPSTPAGGTYTVELLLGGTQVAISASQNWDSLGTPAAWVYVAFSTPVTATGASTYTLRMKASATAKGYWWGSSSTSGTTWGWAVVGNGDDSTKIASGDTMLLKDGVTLTLDENLTVAPIASGNLQSSSHSVLVGDQAIIAVGNPGSLVTLTLGTGNITCPSSGSTKFGLVGTKTGAAKFKIVTTQAASGVMFDLYANYTVLNASRNTWEWYGESTTNVALNISADCAASQVVLTTVEDIPASWTTNDVLVVCGKDTATSNVTTYTLASKGTKTVNVNTNLDVKVLQGGRIINYTEAQRSCGIWISSTNNIRLTSSTNAVYCDFYRIDGVYFENVVPCFPIDTPTYSSTSSYVKNICSKVTYNASAPMFYVNKSGFVAENVHMANLGNGQTTPILLYGKNGTATNITVFNYNANAYLSGSLLPVATYCILGTNCTLDNFVWQSATSSTTYQPMVVTGYANTIRNGYLVGGRLILRGAGGIYFYNVKQQRSSDYGLVIENAFATFDSCTIGVGATNATKDVYHYTDCFSQVGWINTKIGSQGVDNNITTAVTGSWLRSVTHNSTTGEMRSWTPEGLTYFTSATSNKLEAWNLQNSIFTNRYNVGTETVTGMGVLILVKCQINNSAYYAGSYELPKLRVTYDTGTEVVATASANTTEQTLSVYFSPTTNGNPISIKLTEKTDQTAENGEVKWSNLSIAGALYGYNFSSWLKVIDRMTDDTIYTITTPSANTLVTADISTVATYTGMTINYSTQAVTTTGAGGVPVNSIAKAYDYSQYHYTQNMTTGFVWLYSIDGGLSYYCDTDWSMSGTNITATSVTLRMKSGKMLTLDGARWTGTIAGNVTLASAGTYPIILDGARNITFSGTGTFDLRGGTFPGTITLNNTSGGNVTVQLLPGVTVVNNGPNITLDNTVSVTVAGSNIVAGSNLYIQNTTDGTNIVNAVNAGTTYSGSVNYSSDKALSVVIRKKGYKTQEFTGTMTSAGFSFVANQEADPTTNPSYNAGMATDWSYDTGTKKFSKLTSNVNTVQDFHSYWNDYFANTARMAYPVPTSAATKYDVSLINGATFNASTDPNGLKTGSITEVTGDNLYGSIISLGNATTEAIYLIQNGSKVTSWWSAGNVDILLKVKSGGTLIDSGKVHVFSRDYGRVYAHGLLTIIESGKNYVSVNVGADVNNTTAKVSLPVNIVVTQSAQTGKQIDSADTPANYDFKVDGGGNSVQLVFEYLKSITDIDASGTIHGVAGYYYTGWDSAYTEVQNGPLGSFLGGKFYGARGLWLENVATGDALNYVLIDSSGNSHQAALPPVTLDVTNIVNGSRLRIYDSTASSELVNAVVSGTSYSYNYTYPGLDHDMIVTLTYVNGATSAKLYYQTQGTATINGMSIRADQQDDPAWAILGIDGSTVTEWSVSGGLVEAFVNDSDNLTSWGRLYAWWQYLLTTATGIAQYGNYFRTNDGVNFVAYSSFKVKNIKNAPLTITGGYITPYGGGVPTDVMDTSGYSMFMGYPHVVGFAYSSGSGLSTEEHDKLMSINPTGGGMSTGQFIGLKD